MKKLRVLLVLLAFAGLARAQALPEVWNDTHDLSNPQIAGWLRDMLPPGHLAEALAPGRTVYAGVKTLRAGPHGTGALLCEARLGLTHQPVAGLRPRLPSAIFPALDRRVPATEPGPTELWQCEAAALRSAIAAAAKAPLQDFTRSLEATRQAGGEQAQDLPEDGGRARLYLAGLRPGTGAQGVMQALPDPFLRSYDYRRGAVVVLAEAFTLHKRMVCFATAGLAGRYPDGRTARTPAVYESAAHERSLGRPPGQDELEACRARAATLAVQRLLAQRWNEDELFSDYADTREDGVALPDFAAVSRAQPARP